MQENIHFAAGNALFKHSAGILIKPQNIVKVAAAKAQHEL